MARERQMIPCRMILGPMILGMGASRHRQSQRRDRQRQSSVLHPKVPAPTGAQKLGQNCFTVKQAGQNMAYAARPSLWTIDRAAAAKPEA